jgi:hypothetical protein
MRRNMGQILVGLILLFLGGFFLLSNFGLLRGEGFLIFLGLAFVAAYVLAGRNVGLLVPGTVLVATGAFSYFEHLRFLGVRSSGGWFFVFLGLAFAAVFVIDSPGRTHPPVWALFPAAGLGLFGLFVMATETLPRSFWRLSGTWWPAILILLGAAIALRPRR